MNRHHHSKEERLKLQARFASRVTSVLNQGADDLPRDISERLRIARMQAVQHARLSSVAAAAASPVGVGADGSASLGQAGNHWFTTLAAWLPLVVLVAGLFAIQSWHEGRRIDAAAEVDAALLADDLPPSAYGDPGFVEFLKQRER